MIVPWPFQFVSVAADMHWKLANLTKNLKGCSKIMKN